MLRDIITTIKLGKPFKYQDEFITLIINPDPQKKEISEFLKYCENIPDDLFIEICESFEDGELNQLQKQLDTENYKDTIITFKSRAKELAERHLTEITNSLYAEKSRLENIIFDAKYRIDNICKELEQANNKYNV